LINQSACVLRIMFWLISRSFFAFQMILVF
jgi:hypothetical protein